MCGGPIIRSVFGLSLEKSTIGVGCLELLITIIATVLNVVKYSKGYDSAECDNVDVCIGPLIKYSVFDALFGIVCSLMLIIGGHTRNVCLLISWMVVTFFTSFKYLWVVVTHDWTNIEDYISITYLLFYIGVFVIVWSLYRQIVGTPVNYINTAQPSSTIILQQTFIPAQQQQQQYLQPLYPQQQPLYPQQPPPYQQPPPPYNPKY